ncbi:hypothetical protein R3P38DRAFT_3170516 [Favolaschia claudopus]|uniref:Oxoglutarate/iron-dependent oxygenase C-terminal degradation domain-containing protein n=1 Tax=Favolaschia claudopus TaxID=2862362 RepID=A0AAW0DXU3_9AGAR
MDPLKLDNLTAVEDWGTFTPDMKGYIPPQELELWDAFETIEEQLREHIDTSYMRDNDAPIIASSLSKGFPVAKLIIENETFAVPLSRRETASLAHDLGNNSWNRMAINKPQIVNDDAVKTIESVEWDVLRKLRATHGNNSLTSRLERLEVFKAGSHQISTAAESDSHQATVFVFLPTLTDSVSIHMRATYESCVSDVDLPTNLSGSACAVAIYTGIEHAVLDIGAGDEVTCLIYHQSAGFDEGDELITPCLANLSGALPPLRDVFCLWRHELIHNQDEPTVRLFFLECHPERARDFVGDDATLLCHLAPLAKAYGFKMYISQLIYTESTTQEVYHEYEDYLEECETSKLQMSSRPRKTYEWVGLRDLGGQEVKQPDLLRLAKTMVKNEKGYYYVNFLEDLDHESDWEGVDDTKYYATVEYTHVRTATVLFVVA